MSGYEFTHPLMPERDSCAECGHSIWRMPYAPMLGPETKQQHEHDQMVRRLTSAIARDLYRPGDVGGMRGLVDWANVTKEGGEPFFGELRVVK